MSDACICDWSQGMGPDVRCPEHGRDKSDHAVSPDASGDVLSAPTLDQIAEFNGNRDAEVNAVLARELLALRDQVEAIGTDHDALEGREGGETKTWHCTACGGPELLDGECACTVAFYKNAAREQRQRAETAERERDASREYVVALGVECDRHVAERDAALSALRKILSACSNLSYERCRPEVRAIATAALESKET